ncbi:MAG: helix-turn-helix domain-containing protein [Actinomycetota bacterium]
MLLEDTANDFDGWQGLVSDSFVPLDTEPQRRGGFQGRISARDYDSVVMSQINANPHAVLRTPELIARARSEAHGCAAGTNCFKVSLQLDGHGLLIQDGREMTLAPGSLAIYDTSRPYTLSFDSDFSSYVMMFPQSRVNLPAGTVGQLTATPIGADHQLGAVVAQVISQAGAMLPTLSRTTGVRLAGNVVDLLTTVMADELSAAGGEIDERQQLWAEITDYIDVHLSDPQLSPSTIAAAHFISVRTLHQIFEGTGETVAGEIRRRRIEKCRLDLADPGQRQTPVAAIGARWGLSDPAHFSRLFRSAVGQPPAGYRRSIHAD